MTERFEKDALKEFGKALMQRARDQSIEEQFIVIDGLSKAPSNQLLHEELKDFSGKQFLVLRKMVVLSVDRALDNFLWLLEDREDFEMVSYYKDKILSLKNISDGLSVDYWNFVDYFSEYKMLEDILDSTDTGPDAFLKKREPEKSEESEK